MNFESLRIAYEQITPIQYLAKKQVYDIKLEGTHNVVAGGIVAYPHPLEAASSYSVIHNSTYLKESSEKV